MWRDPLDELIGLLESTLPPTPMEEDLPRLIDRSNRRSSK